MNIINLNVSRSHLIFVAKGIMALLIIIFLLGLYPLHLFPTASMYYTPDGSDEWETAGVVEVEAGDTLVQEYHPGRALKVISIEYVIDHKTANPGDMLCFTVYDAENAVMGRTGIELANIGNRTRQTVPLKTQKLEEGNTYFIAVQIEGFASAGLYLVDKKAEAYLSTAYVNGEPCSDKLLLGMSTKEYADRDVGLYAWIMGTLLCSVFIVPWKKIGYVYLRSFIIIGLSILFLMMSYYQKIAGLIEGYSALKKLYLGFVIISVAVMLLHAYMTIRKVGRKVEKCFLVSAVGWGIIYLTLMPPYAYPDEPTHYAQANAFVNQLTGQEVRDEKKQIYIRSEELIENVSFPGRDSLNGYYDNCLVNEGKTGYGTMDIVNGRGLSRVSPVCYLPFEAGILIARIFNLNYVWSFALSNMLGLLCYALIIYVSICIMPAGKWILFLSAQFPLALSMATSFTYDMMNYSLLTLFFALFFSTLFKQENINWREALAFVLIGIIVFPIKYAYLPFCLFVLLLPEKKFGWRHVRIIKVVFVCICLVFALKDNVLVSHFSHGSSSKPKEAVTENEAFDIKELYKKKETSWQSVNELVGDKGNFIKYAYNTFYKHLDYYWNGMIGFKIGWGDSFIPDYVYNVWWLLILFSILGMESGKYLLETRIRAGTFLICVLSFGAIYMAMFLFATPVGYTDCPSIGARYLLPLLLPLCVALRGKKITIPGGVSEELFVWGADLCQIIALVYMFAGYMGR